MNNMDHLDNDDAPVGRILSRREALAVLSAAGAAMLAACAPRAATTTTTTTQAPTSAPTPSTGSGQAPLQSTATVAATATSVATAEAAPAATTAAATEAPVAEAVLPACVVSPAMTEGPYFVDEKLNRSDIRVNTSDNKISEGALFKLTLRVAGISGVGCTPLAGALVDIWHCDALGVYSDATDRSFNTVGQNFLRGYQVTDANGAVTFDTIYPGWYPGRAVHIHFKIRNDPASSQGFEFTSQFFFPETTCSEVYAQAPYASKGDGFCATYATASLVAAAAKPRSRPRKRQMAMQPHSTSACN